MNRSARNVRTKGFKEQFNRLPERIQRVATRIFRRFRADPSDPTLRHHALAADQKGRHRSNSYSVSITMQYRAIYTRDGDTNVWYWIGTHADYDTFISS
jgi:hypothetical protein